MRNLQGDARLEDRKKCQRGRVFVISWHALICDPRYRPGIDWGFVEIIVLQNDLIVFDVWIR